jgi:phage major head subunit gpT-like protein
MTPIVRGEWAELLAPGLNMRTFNAYRERAEVYRLINRVLTSDSAWEDDWAMAGFGPLVEKSELGTTMLDKPVKLGGVRIFHKTFALGFAISLEMKEDSKYNIAADLAGSLGRSSRITAELWGHDVWNNAFSGAKYTGRDGQPLISNAHPIQGTGGTASNKPAVDTDLSQAALEAAWGAYQTQVDERGLYIDLMPRILLVHPSQYLLARRLLETAGYPGGNNNDINPIQGMLTPVMSPYLTDQDAWFILPEADQLDVRFYWRRTPDTKTWDDDNADATFHKIRQRHGVGFGDWRGVYGSPGA